MRTLNDSTVMIIEDQVREVLDNFEPRVGDVGVEVDALMDNMNLRSSCAF